MTVLTFLARRWPTWLALALAALSLSDTGDGREIVFVLPLAAAGYAGMAIADRPAATWPVLVVMTAAVVALRAAGVDPWPVLAGAAVALAGVGLLGGQLRRPGLYAAQAPAALGFVAVGVAAVAVPAGVGAYLAAAGLIGHAVWDAVHWRIGTRIVARSFAEWCAVLDLVLGAGILVLALR